MLPSIVPGRLSVIIPAYNEEQAILTTIRETAAALDGLDFEIIVVDDGSSDTTHSRVQQVAAADERVQAVRYDLNAGKGHALRYGFGFATGERVAFLDADLDLHPRHLLQFQQLMNETGADVVIGSKRHPQSQLDYPWHRRVVSSVYFFLVKLMFGLPIRDTQTGVKLFKREVLARIFPRLLVKNFAQDLELLVVAHHLGYRIVEAPVVLEFSRGSYGRIGLGAIWATWWDTMAVFYRMTLLRFYDEPPAGSEAARGRRE
ncbi:MAG: glycosyltransferase [Chloroflexota bacterium]